MKPNQTYTKLKSKLGPKSAFLAVGVVALVAAIIISAIATYTIKKNLTISASNSSEMANDGVMLNTGFAIFFCDIVLMGGAIIGGIIAIVCLIAFLIELKKENYGTNNSDAIFCTGGGTLASVVATVLVALPLFTTITVDPVPTLNRYYTSSTEHFYENDCAKQASKTSNDYSMVVSDPEKGYQEAKRTNPNVGSYEDYLKTATKSFEYYLVLETLCQVKDSYDGYSFLDSELEGLTPKATNNDLRKGKYKLKSGPVGHAPSDYEIVVIVDEACGSDTQSRNTVSVYSPLIHNDIRLCGYMYMNRF